MIKWLKKLLSAKVYLFPIKYDENFSLGIGDELEVVLENQKYDYIAGLVGKSMEDSGPGTSRTWKVTDIVGNEPLLECGREKIYLKYLDWDDDNRVIVKANLLHGEEFYRFFHRVRDARLRLEIAFYHNERMVEGFNDWEAEDIKIKEIDNETIRIEPRGSKHFMAWDMKNTYYTDVIQYIYGRNEIEQGASS